MDSELKEKWVKALRYGGGKQCKEVLFSLDGSRCAFGVLVEVAGMGGFINLFDAGRTDDWCSGAAGVPVDHKVRIADMNDAGRSFDQIADYIEEHL